MCHGFGARIYCSYQQFLKYQYKKLKKLGRKRLDLRLLFAYIKEQLESETVIFYGFERKFFNLLKFPLTYHILYNILREAQNIDIFFGRSTARP